MAIDAERSAEKEFSVEIDGTPVRVPSASVTGLQIMEAAAIPAATGLLELLEDGTQRQVRPDEVFDLEQARRFKKRPKFKRG